MSALARLFIAAAVCPALGAAVGGHLGGRAADWAGESVGGLARWEMAGVLVGVGLGVVFAWRMVVCILFRGEDVRHRIADPILIALGVAALLELASRREAWDAEATSTIRGISAIVWCVGLVFAFLAPAEAPMEEEPLGEEPPEDEPPDDGPDELLYEPDEPELEEEHDG